jgi:hypothetical protein
MAARYEKFLPKLLVQLMDCPEPVAIDALRSACIEFCEKTLWWLHEPEPMPLVDGAGTYPLDTPTGTVPVMVFDAWAAGQRMLPQTEEQLTTQFPDWRGVTGTPRSYMQYDPSEIILCPTPDERVEEGLKMVIAVRPSQDSVYVDDSIYEYWNETIVGGALSKLYLHAGRPYSLPAAAPVQQAIFDRGISAARAKRQRGMTRGPLHVKMRNW